MTDKPEALRRADQISIMTTDHRVPSSYCDAILSAAAELRRMHAECERLTVEVGYQRGMFSQSEAECERLRADAERYQWLRDVSVPPHNFYLSVPVEFDGVRYTRAEVDAGIDAAIDAARKEQA